MSTSANEKAGLSGWKSGSWYFLPPGGATSTVVHLDPTRILPELRYPGYLYPEPYEPGLKPASDYKLIRRFRLSRQCRGSCLDFRLPTGTLRLADYLGRARSDWQLIIGDPSANYNPTTPFPDYCMTKKCASCDKIVIFWPILYRPVRRGGSLGANEPPFEMWLQMIRLQL